MCGITGINLAVKENSAQLEENYFHKLEQSIGLISHKAQMTKVHFKIKKMSFT